MTKQKALFHAIVEREADSLSFGSVSFDVLIKDGQPVIETLKITRAKRVKYNNDKQTQSGCLRPNQYHIK